MGEPWYYYWGKKRKSKEKQTTLMCPPSPYEDVFSVFLDHIYP